MSKNFRILTWNIGGPSLERAKKQFQWLEKQPVDVFVLTECKNSNGCLFLERSFKGHSIGTLLKNSADNDDANHVVFPKPSGNGYGVLIASKHKLVPSSFAESIDFLRPRVNSVTLSYLGRKIEVIGVYTPSRGSEKKERRQKKKRFVDSFLNALENVPVSRRRILIGDYNVVEPNHVPHYSGFEDWEYDFYRVLKNYQLQDAFRYLHPTAQEYSWFGLTGKPYRYDHCFVSTDILPLVDECYYFHEPRELKLSDHSALVTTIKIG